MSANKILHNMMTPPKQSSHFLATACDSLIPSSILYVTFQTDKHLAHSQLAI